jgi:hypothetical protein
MEEQMSEASLEEVVAEAKAPGKFSIINVLKERAYPSENIDIYIDESIAYNASEIDKRIKEIDRNSDEIVADSDALQEAIARRDELIIQRDSIIEELGGNKYVFTITGISEGVREDLYKLSTDKYPVQVEKKMNPFTGQDESEELESLDRNRLFTNLLWQGHITKIVAPNGDVQDGITAEEAVELRRSLPIASSGKITEAIEKIRTATAIFMMTVDEDFLAKS